jgi:hypothetical protein
LFPLFALPVAFTLLTALTYGSRDLRCWVAPIVAVVVATLSIRRLEEERLLNGDA